jgi:hypothetical protein
MKKQCSVTEHPFQPILQMAIKVAYLMELVELEN